MCVGVEHKINFHPGEVQRVLWSWIAMTTSSTGHQVHLFGTQMFNEWLSVLCGLFSSLLLADCIVSTMLIKKMSPFFRKISYTVIENRNSRRLLDAVKMFFSDWNSLWCSPDNKWWHIGGVCNTRGRSLVEVAYIFQAINWNLVTAFLSTEDMLWYMIETSYKSKLNHTEGCP